MSLHGPAGLPQHVEIIFFVSAPPKVKESEVKRGPGRPRRYPSAQEEGPSDGSKPVEVSIVAYQTAESAVDEVKKEPQPQQQKKKVQLDEVLELAVQSMSATLGEEMDEQRSAVDRSEANEGRKNFDAAEDRDSDFEWKLDNDDEATATSATAASTISPPAKRKKMGANHNVILPTVSFYTRLVTVFDIDSKVPIGSIGFYRVESVARGMEIRKEMSQCVG